MPLHTQVDESSQDEGLEVNPVYVRELSCEIPRYRLPAHGVLPRTALQVVRDELILDGNARLNLATFVTTWMEPEAEQLMAECAAKNMGTGAPELFSFRGMVSRSRGQTLVGRTARS